MAIDIDAPLNWRQWRLDYSRLRLTRAQIEAVESIRTGDGWQVFRSGIHFRHIDPMHFQGSAPISSILTGIEGITVATHHHHEGHTVTHHHSKHSTVTGPKLPILKRGSRGQAVRNLQGLLEAHGEHLRIDGVFGRGSEQAVEHMQKAHHLAVDGVVGARSWKALLDE
jgi:peptidoglycan hydrolase-like protein with peptidoglycan-binding domain